MQLSRPTPLLLGAMLIGGALAIYFMLLKPAYNEVNILRGKIAFSDQEATRKENDIDQIKRLLSQYNDTTLGELRERVSMALPLEAKTEEIADQLATFAQRRFLTLEKINFEAPKDAPAIGGAAAMGYSVLNIKLTVIGAYENFRQFLGDVESNLRIMDAGSIVVEGSSDPESAVQNIFSYAVELQAYYQLDKPPPPVNRPVARPASGE